MTFFAILFLVGTFQAQGVPQTVPIDADHTVVLSGGGGEPLKLAIQEKSGATWELSDASFRQEQLQARIGRVDRSSVVIERRDPDYGVAQASLKFFFDLAGRKLIKVIPFGPHVSVVQLSETDQAVCANVRGEETAFSSCGDATTQTIVAQLGPSANLPEPLPHPLSDSPSPLPVPLPQSTYDQFARARPDRVRDGYRRDGTTIDERVGAHQVAGDRIWFGKAFYDGEGTTGVGGIGYFDTRTKRFTMMPVPDVTELSVSAMLVETGAVWAGLVAFPEGAERSGGLIRYELSSGNVTRYDIPDIPLVMLRRDDTLYIGTSNGLYFLRESKVTRVRFEPNLEGQFEPVHDPI